MRWLYIVLFTILDGGYLIYYFKKYRWTPVTIFIPMQMTFFYGICFHPWGNTPTVVKLELLYVIANACFILGVEIASRTRNYSAKTGSTALDRECNDYQSVVIWTITAVAVALCLYLFVVSGTNLFIQSLKDFFSNTTTVYKDERAEFRNVSGMGYIYQFRVVLLPLLATYFLFGTKRYPKIFKIGLYLFMIVSLLGTGQRNAFVFYCLVFLLFVYSMSHDFGIVILKTRHLVIFGAIAFFFLMVSTIANGRVEGGDSALKGAFDSIMERLFFVNQDSAIVGFKYMDSQETVWGYDWWMMLKQILPGKVDYVPVDSISYHIAYGNWEGTNPPCLWGSAWYNFNWLGVTVFPLIMGMLYHKVYRTMVRRENKTKLYMLIYSALCVYLGIWSYGTPMTLFNNGVITLLFLRWLLFTAFTRRKQPALRQGSEFRRGYGTVDKT